NGWMNHPTGFRLENGKAVDVHPWSALFLNSYFWPEFVHMYFAGFLVTGFLVAGVYAWGYLRGRFARYHRTALTTALSAAAPPPPGRPPRAAFRRPGSQRGCRSWSATGWQGTWRRSSR